MARVCVGRITAAHGVRGLVRIQSFTSDPEALAAYGALEDEAGRRRLAVKLLSSAKGQFVARIDGIEDRDAAEALAGTMLFVERARLPPPDEEDEFYQADLLGLRVETLDGTILGTLRTINDFGAGDVLEIELAAGGTLDLPFTRTVVPVVDVQGGRLVVDPPESV